METTYPALDRDVVAWYKLENHKSPCVKADLTVAETAERLGVSTIQVWRLLRDGTLSARQNPFDRRQKLIPAGEIERIERAGRSTRASAHT